MIIVSIVILFCDKDVKYLAHILKEVRDYIHVSYEVILVDNRVNDNSPLPIGNYKLVKPNENSYQFEGRRKGLDEAKGIYTWFVDVDDDITDTLEQSDFIGKMNYDIIQMYFDSPDFPKRSPGTYHDKKIFSFGVMLWSRLIKTEFLKRIFKPIKRGLILSGYDDSYTTYLLAENITSIAYIDKNIYKYNYPASLRYNVSFTKEKYNKIEIGAENLEYLCTFLKDKDTFMHNVEFSRELYKSRIKE